MSFPTVKLNNGVEMPQLGFGVFRMPNLVECERSVLTAFETGYRSIDTAAAYENEKAVGEAIRKCGIPRNEIFITTKLWLQGYGYESALRAFELSMEKLGLEYLDLYLLHQPYSNYYDSWRALEKLYSEGRIRAIGVSNFYPDRLVDLVLNNKIVPAVNQVETHPFSQQVEPMATMAELGVQIESWGPFAEGSNSIFANALLQDIANKHGKTVAQVILRWHIQRGVVVIPKSVHVERIRENFSIWDFELDDNDMAAIAALDTGYVTLIDHRSAFTARRINGIRH